MKSKTKPKHLKITYSYYNLMKKREQTSINNLYMKNNIALQAKITELLISINSLTEKLNRIANTFEEAEKELKRKAQPGLEPLMKKVSDLDQQNKAIADTLLSLEKYFEKDQQPIQPRQMPPMQPRQLPKRPPF